MPQTFGSAASVVSGGIALAPDLREDCPAGSQRRGQGKGTAMDRFGLTQVATWRPTLNDGSGGDDGAEIEGLPVAHRYGRLELRLGRDGAAPPTAGALPPDLTPTERLGLSAAQLRESPE